MNKMARCFPENRTGRFRVRGHWLGVIQLAVLTAFLLVVSTGNVDSLHLTMATRYFYHAGGSDIRLACYRSSPDTDADLSYGRVPVPLPGPGIESATSFPDGTITDKFNGQEFKQLPPYANATGLYYCEGRKGDQSNRVYSTTFNYNRWFFPGSLCELQLTKTNNKGEEATLTVEGASGSTGAASWRRIRDGVVTNLTDYDGMGTVTIPASQAKHGDVYAVVDSSDSLSDNRFTLIRLIVRGCAAGKWGPPACDGVCDLCYHGGVCDDKTGDCICPPGFSGPNCLTICPSNSFGWDCEHRCDSSPILRSCYRVQFGLPDPFGITCINGHWGYYCSEECPSGRFGAGCSEECHCRFADDDCNQYTGECYLSDCAEGWSGTNCQISDVCPVGYYGLNCVSKCRCYSNAACDKYTGYCSAGCAPGFNCVSQKCDEAGYFGKNCSQECLCLDDPMCDGITGACHGTGLCIEQYQTDGTGICQFVLPVLSQPPEVTVQYTSAIVSWKAWGSHPMDAGDGPIIGYKVYRSDPLTSSWIEAGNVSASYQPPEAFSFEAFSLQQLTVYNFSVAAVREGKGGEGPRSPETTAQTKPLVPDACPVGYYGLECDNICHCYDNAACNKDTGFCTEGCAPGFSCVTTAESVGCPATTAGSNIGLIVAVGVIAAVIVVVVVVVIVVVVDYLRFRKLNKHQGEHQIYFVRDVDGDYETYGNSLAQLESQGISVAMQGCEDVENAEGGASMSAYEDTADRWVDRLTIPGDRLTISDEVIQTGHFGEVRKATLNLNHGQVEAAVKHLSKSNSSASARRMFIEEYRTLANIGTHPNLVNILAVCFDEDAMYVGLEYQPNGDLRSYLRNARSQADDSSSSLSAVKLLQMAADVAKGMQHVAASGVIHRKLAARSVLLDANLVAKVSGFGQARCAGAIIEKSKVSIPPRWLSLESLTTNIYTSKSDVWSFGILLWEIGSMGATPYSGIESATLETRLENGYRLPKPDNCDSEIYELMIHCWQEDPKKRPPFKKLASNLGTMARSNKPQILPIAGSHRYMNIRPDQDDN